MLVLSFLAAFASLPAGAWTVDRLTDSVSAVANDGSLRGAIIAANAAAGTQTIDFNIPGGGVITLTANAAGSRMLPVLTNAAGITIDGANAGQGSITIDGGSSSAVTGDRIFFMGLSSGMGGTATPSALYTLTNLTLRKGNARGGAGGGAGGGGAGLGGAVFVNAGTLVLNNVSFTDNRATGGDAALGFDGGAGGMGGNGGTAVGGGGGVGLGANGGLALPSNQTQAPGAGSFPSGTGSAGFGRDNGIMGGSTINGAERGGGGGGGSHGGGGGISGGNWFGMGGGQSSSEIRGGLGGFGGGGGASGIGSGFSTGIGGNGGYGGGGGAGLFSSSPYFGSSRGGSGGFGGGGGNGLLPGAGGYGGGDAVSSPGAQGGGGGGGAGMGGAVFVRAGAGFKATGSITYAGNSSAGGASVNFAAASGLGLGGNVLIDAWTGATAVTTATDLVLDSSSGILAGFRLSTASTKLTVNGTVQLNGAALHLIPVVKGSAVPGTGQVFVIVDNDGTDPIQGTFAGIAENSTVTFNGMNLTASYQGGTGNDFTLSSVVTAAPSLSAVSGSGFMATNGTVSCTVNPNGLTTTVTVDYGLTAAYGASASISLSPDNGTSPQNVSTSLSGLSSGSVYHYRVTASNSTGSVSSSDQTFQTQPLPYVTVGDASLTSDISTYAGLSVTTSGATVHSCGIEYGTTTSYGVSVGATSAPIVGSGTTNLSVQLTGLLPNTTYHYRGFASNSYGTAYSQDKTFTTLDVHPGWRQQNFGVSANAEDAADEADPDKDGLPNLVEWACNLDPNAAGALPATTTRGAGSLDYVYTRSLQAVNAGASFVVEWSDTLGSNDWHTTGVTETIVSSNSTTQQVKASVAAPSGTGQRFIRLTVIAPP